MTLSETTTVMEKIVYAYPNFFSNINLEVMIKVWHEELSDLDFDKTFEKLSGFIKENKYPPTISEIRLLTYERWKKFD